MGPGYFISDSTIVHVHSIPSGHLRAGTVIPPAGVARTIVHVEPLGQRRCYVIQASTGHILRACDAALHTPNQNRYADVSSYTTSSKEFIPLPVLRLHASSHVRFTASVILAVALASDIQHDGNKVLLYPAPGLYEWAKHALRERDCVDGVNDTGIVLNGYCTSLLKEVISNPRHKLDGVRAELAASAGHILFYAIEASSPHVDDIIKWVEDIAVALQLSGKYLDITGEKVKTHKAGGYYWVPATVHDTRNDNVEAYRMALVHGPTIFYNGFLVSD